MSDLINIADAIEALRNVPPAWIPCSEKLPEIGKVCLITATNGRHGTVDIDIYTDYGWDDYGVDVVAWMPLPAPWKKAVYCEE